MHYCIPYSFSLGAELYVDQSSNYNTRLVANNSIIVHCDSLTMNCVREVEVYCYSNTTLEENEAGGVTFPNGISYSTTQLNSQYTVRKLHSAVNLVVKTRLNQGIYSFMLPDSNGNILHLSVGIYESYPGKKVKNTSAMSAHLYTIFFSTV